MDTAGNEPFEKLEKQLDETQALGWRMGQYMAESRNVLSSCIRLKSELQYEYFTELILEAAKTAEKLTEKMRRLTLEVTINPVQYERYKEELVMIHGIEVEYEKEILKVSLPLLIPHRKEVYTNFIYKPLHIALQNWYLEQVKSRSGKFPLLKSVWFVLSMFTTRVFPWLEECGTMTTLRKNMCLISWQAFV